MPTQADRLRSTLSRTIRCSSRGSGMPQPVSALTAPVVSFSTGGFHALALLENGTLWAWGDNSSGELGDGTATLHSSPVLVGGGLSKAIELIAGRVHSFGFLGDFSLFAWGDNAGGQLGEGTENTRLSPVPVVGFGGATSLAPCDPRAAINENGAALLPWVNFNKGFCVLFTTLAVSNTPSARGSRVRRPSPPASRARRPPSRRSRCSRGRRAPGRP